MTYRPIQRKDNVSSRADIRVGTKDATLKFGYDVDRKGQGKSDVIIGFIDPDFLSAVYTKETSRSHI